jgi:hypothetical protein
VVVIEDSTKVALAIDLDARVALQVGGARVVQLGA